MSMRPFGSILSKLNNFELVTADGIKVAVQNNILTKIALRLWGIPHMGLRIRARIISKSPHKTGVLLDAGCGVGIYDLEFGRRSTFRRIVGIDLDQSKLSLAQNHKKDLNLQNVFFNIGNLTYLPYKDKSFDHIICSDVLEHINNDTKVIEEFFRVLKLQGRLIVTVPSDCAYNKNVRDFGHVRPGYNKAALFSLVEKAGFKILEFEHTFKFFGRIAWSLNRAMLSSKILACLTFYPLYLISYMDAVVPISRNDRGLVLLATKP